MIEREVILSNGKVAYISNQLADGTYRESMDGYPVPYNEKTAVAYQIYANLLMKAIRKARMNGESAAKSPEDSEEKR